MVAEQRENTPLIAINAERSSRHRILSNRSLFYAILPLLIVIIIPISLYFSLSKPNIHVLPSDSNHKTHDVNYSQPPFDTQRHPIPPKLINRKNFPQAIPTNSFWSNLLVGDSHGLNIGAGEITLSPYTIRNLPQRLEISYGDSRRQVSETSIYEIFHMDLGISCFRSEKEMMTREVIAFDSLSVTVRYDMVGTLGTASVNEPKRTMHAYLVRGAPYITVEYHNVMPALELNGSLIGVNGETYEERKQWTGKRFELDVRANENAKSQKWIIYFASDRTLTLHEIQQENVAPYTKSGALTTPVKFRLVDAHTYTGIVRAAVVPNHAFMPILDQYAHMYPIGADLVTYTRSGIGYIQYNWKTQRFPGDFLHNDLLMMAHPHQVETLTNLVKKIATSSGFRTLKSNMTAVIGTKWSFQIPLIDVGFGTDIPIQFEPVGERSRAIREALMNDSTYTPKAQDPYFFGKEISRQARLVLIAETLQEITLRDKILDRIEKWITPWLTGNNSDPFVYDQVWGGICSKNGLRGIFWMTDFGNGWYNDHHFHYGYILYTLAVYAKYRPEYIQKHHDAVLSLVRDIANPEENDPFFPFTRHFSWFDGHSFASGVYTLDGGKSQESVSEAINAYYAVYLLGSAMKMTKYREMGHLLMTLESRAAELYWQMPSNSNIYEHIYAKNKMTGQVACTKVQYKTWFGPQAEHMHLVNMIPFTPITRAFLKKPFVEEEYPVLAEQTWRRSDYAMDIIWIGYAALDLAIIHPQEAWEKVSALNAFDDGSSKTNSLFWIATQCVSE